MSTALSLPLVPSVCFVGRPLVDPSSMDAEICRTAKFERPLQLDYLSPFPHFSDTCLKCRPPVHRSAPLSGQILILSGMNCCSEFHRQSAKAHTSP
ncbi:hypothetical protein BCR44DRAFT_1216247 [Catenaria anguillulae PL171]|uniref:Uncharacterized protein n=1 Tax=Catenaria anguillulae PL171 TaxID=765915 RepID=A0A1Y2I1G8_9FUNG|nr:hypothetical protein BCR44DRAFT_1216247 [Catenaria anguillulae PL171]